MRFRARLTNIVLQIFELWTKILKTNTRIFTRSFEYIDDSSSSRMVFTTYSNPIDGYYSQEHVSSDACSGDVENRGSSVASSKAEEINATICTEGPNRVM